MFNYIFINAKLHDFFYKHTLIKFNYILGSHRKYDCLFTENEYLPKLRFWSET